MAITDHLEHSPVGNPSIPRKTQCDRFNIKNAKRINAEDTCQYMSVWNLIKKHLSYPKSLHTKGRYSTRINDKHDPSPRRPKHDTRPGRKMGETHLT